MTFLFKNFFLKFANYMCLKGCVNKREFRPQILKRLPIAKSFEKVWINL
ncbi:hypothetical protein P9202_124 [Prochlorococcus marinus str. MIT 9202]|nr:hypothetical protein P9202_124 [Prochlorococcus marinus str. MIT 9202]